MITDATDKLLVDSVVERGKRRDVDGDLVQPEQEDEIGAHRRPESGCRAGRPGHRRGERRAALGGPPVKLDHEEAEESPTREGLERQDR